MPRPEQNPRWPTLEASLRASGARELKALVRFFGPRPPQLREAAIAHLLETVRGEGLRRTWERLGDLEKTAVAEAAHSPEFCFVAERFRAKYGAVPDFGDPEASERPRPTLLNLFLRSGKWLPQDLAAGLREFVPAPEPAKVRTVDGPPPSVSRKRLRGGKEVVEAVRLARQETAPAALHDVLAVLRLVDSGKVTVGETTRRPTGAALAAVRSVLADGDFYPEEPIRAFAWPLIVQAAGLAASRGSRLELTKKGREALSAPVHETLGGAWESWLSTDLLDEMTRVEAIKGQSGRGKRALTDPWQRRDAIAETLALCPPGRWIEVDEFFRFLRAAGPEWQVTDDPWTVYLAEPEYGSLGYAGFHDWKILEARYALAFLFEYAATMGLLDVAYATPEGARPDFYDNWGTDNLDCLSRYDGLACLRLNALGSFCLGITERFEGTPLEAKGALRVLPDLEVVAAEGALPPADRLLLERFAEKVSDRVWRLDRGRILAASEAGMAPSALAEFLSARSGSPLPETVEVFLRDIGERCGRVVDRGGARLFECGDEYVARLLENDSRMRGLCLRAGERHLVVPAEKEAAFRRALREAGFATAPAGGGGEVSIAGPRARQRVRK